MTAESANCDHTRKANDFDKPVFWIKVTLFFNYLLMREENDEGLGCSSHIVFFER